MTFVAAFAPTEEQELLAKTARRLLEGRSPADRVRAAIDDGGFDVELWRELAGLGWPGLAVAEAHGGAGYGPVEVGVVMEELGRALACVPYLSSAVLATTAAAAASPEQCAALLPPVAAGERQLTLACFGPSGVADRDAVAVTATRDGAGWRLDGQAWWVLDGATAELALVTARCADDIRLLVVARDSPGVRVEPLDVMDQTRPQAHLHLDGVRVASDAMLAASDAWPAVQAAVDHGLVAVAREQLGGAGKMLDMAVDHARHRLQFGRAIGSFQAVKHRLADRLVDVESARSVTVHAAQALAAADSDEVEVAVPMAKAWASEVFERVAADTLQLLGGIGFTWEHDAHLWFKRAKSTKLLFGDPRHQRARLARALDL